MTKNKIVLFDIDYTLFDTGAFKGSNLKVYKLYKETRSVLRKLSEAAEIGIFSKGEDEFQRKKLKQTLIDGHFQEKNIHIFLDKSDNIEKVLEKYKGWIIFLADDRLDVLYQAKHFDNSVVTIWVKRGPFAEKKNEKNDFTPDFGVLNLEEIVPIVRDS